MSDIWFVTASGRHVYIAETAPAAIAQAIDPRDVAHALARVNRYGGHAREAYSVAQHSVLVEWLVLPYGDIVVSRWALLHDATEAYLGDVPRPLKALLPDYRKIERTFERAMAIRFGLPHEIPPEVKTADRAALVAEWRDLMPGPVEGHADAVHRLAQVVPTIVPLVPAGAEHAFLRRFDALFGDGGT